MFSHAGIYLCGSPLKCIFRMSNSMAVHLVLQKDRSFVMCMNPTIRQGLYSRLETFLPLTVYAVS
jgi:hypothetical protein